MFKLLRSRAKFFYWIIASTFILFTFVVWGAQCNQGPQQPGVPDAVGKINGVEISWQEWDTAYRNYLAQLRSQGGDRGLTANQRAQAAEAIWESLLRMKIEDIEIERRGIAVSDAEILDTLKNNPPQELLAQYATPEGGVNMDAYLADLANPERDWTGVESYLRMALPRQKLMEDVTSSVVVTEEEIREEYLRQNGRAVAEYLGVTYSDLELDQEASTERLQAYYDAHPDEFEEPEKVVVQLVSFPKAPSADDEAEILALAGEVRQEILDGLIDFAEAAALYSEDGSREQGGDLGTFDRNRMVDEFTEAAFNLPVGEISLPVKTQFGYHLIEVLEQFEEDGSVNEVHARHILFQVTPGEATIVDLYEQAELFVDDARNHGFEAAAADAALTLQNPGAVKRGWDLPGLRDTVQGNLFAFNAEPGDVSRVYENEQAFYVVTLVEKIPAGTTPFADVEPQLVTRVEREMKTEKARELLNPAVGAVQMGRSFADAAGEFGVSHAVTDTFAYSGNVIGVGYNTDFNAACLDHAAGELVPEVETPRGMFALRVLWKAPVDEAHYDGERENLRMRMLYDRQQTAMMDWYEERMEAADIEDNRSFLYGDN